MILARYISAYKDSFNELHRMYKHEEFKKAQAVKITKCYRRLLLKQGSTAKTRQTRTIRR